MEMADPADLEPLAARLEQSDDYRILRRSRWSAAMPTMTLAR
jgi:hypothetical protein